MAATDGSKVDRARTDTTTARRTRRATSTTVASLVATLAVLACTVGISSAATKGADVHPAVRVVASVLRAQALVPSRAVPQNAFCTDAANTQKSNPSAAASDSAASLQADYAKLKSEEPVILGLVPTAIKGDYQVLFNWFNKFYAELASVHYDFLKLTPSSIAALSTANEKQVAAASAAIQAYLKKTCGLTY